MKKRRIRNFWLGSFALTAILLLWVSQSVRSTQVSYQIQKVEEDIKKEQKKYLELEIAKDRYLSLDSLENTASKKLGLVVPGEENIIIVKIPG